MKFTMKNRKMIQNYYQKKKIKKFRKFFFQKMTVDTVRDSKLTIIDSNFFISFEKKFLV